MCSPRGLPQMIGPKMTGSGREACDRMPDELAEVLTGPKSAILVEIASDTLW